MSSGLIIAAPASGSGKTVITLGLIVALKRAGFDVAAAKVGPDYIDPGFLSAAAGARCLNLDPWAMRPQTLSGICARLGETAPLILCEGVMGLFDGATGGSGSTADLASLTGWPVILVVDVRGQAASAAALARGFITFRNDIKFAGVLFNRTGGEGHCRAIRHAMEESLPEVPILGFLPRTADLALPERHLGLVQAREHDEIGTLLDRAGNLIEDNVDLAVVEKSARPTHSRQPSTSTPLPPLGQHIAIARDEAFSFAYDSVLDGWRRQDAELSFFSPLADEAPDDHADAVYLPGGYPELHADRLAENRHFRTGLEAAANRAFIYGECGGFMALGTGLIDRHGARHSMAGLLPLETSFAKPKLHLGYRRAAAKSQTPLGPVGTRFTGHEFHYSTAQHPSGNAKALFACEDSSGIDVGTAGLVAGRVAGSFLHLIDQAQ
ncbi:MAG: cobyrinic acid a,c-diamide synthase [Rhodospirillaceae bacterium]|nr:cobyrinic acid a,c-diamide synthase [Rhodospirillaceae bacterium]HAA90870.1 cobyrinic acid a,c-diamide synthase [Rhodospirillaceae bacterium]